MVMHSKKPIPKWAHVNVNVSAVRKKDDNEPLDNKRREERYLRTKCYHAASQAMDHAAANALQKLAAPVLAELDVLRSMVAPVDPPITEEENAVVVADPPPSSKDTASSTEAAPLRTAAASDEDLDAEMEDLINQFTIPPPSMRYNPLLLPVLILDGPFSGHDRDLWMKHLVRSTKAKHPRCCTVWLRGSSAKSSSSSSWQEELMRQCLGQEPDHTILLSKRKKKRLQKSSITDLLMLWATNTRAFDEIVIFVQVENGNDFYTHKLQDFLQWTAERRALQGLPLTVVLLGPHSFRRPVLLRSSTQGCHGLLVRCVTLPSSRDLLDGWFQELLNQQQFSALFFFPPDWMDTLRETFQNQNRSVKYVVRKLQEAVAIQLTARGSFLSTAPLLMTCVNHRKMMTAFLYDKESLPLLLGPTTRSHAATVGSLSQLRNWLQDYESERLKAAVVMCVQKVLYEQVCGSTEPYVLQSIVRPPLKNADKTLQKEDLYALLAPVARFRAEILNQTTCFRILELWPSEKAKHETAIHKDVLDFTNRLIVLLDRCTTVGDAQKCLTPLLVEMASRSSSPFDGRSLFDNETVYSQPRRDQVRALTADDTQVNVAGRMYRIILDRAAITEREWFDALLLENSFPVDTPDTNRRDLFHLFGYGVRHLKTCGLIRDRRMAGKSGTVYEKTALVWCGGD